MKDLSSAYQLEAVVGRGALGVLHEARQIALDRSVLIRFVAPDIIADREVRERLLEDLRKLGRLQAGGIAQTIDQGEAGGELYYAIERVDGLDLDQLQQEDLAASFFARSQRTTHEERLEAVLEVLRNLARLGSEGFDLRGLDSREVLLTPQFHFLLSEPTLAWTCSRRLGARHRRPTGVEKVVDQILRAALDPTWDTGTTSAGRRGKRARRRPEPMMAEVRLEIFASLSSVSALTPADFLEHAIRFLEERREGQQEETRELPSSSVSTGSQTRGFRSRNRTIYRATLSTLIAASLALFAYPVLVPDDWRLEVEFSQRMESAQGEGDLDALLLAADSTEGPTQLVESALAATRTRVVDEMLAEAVHRIRDGHDVEFEELLLPNTRSEEAVALLRNDLEPPLEQLYGRANRVRELLGADSLERRQQELDRLISERGQLDQAVVRVLLVELLGDPDSELRSRSAASIAAGLAGAPRHLDDVLAGFLDSPAEHRAIALALVGYFSKLPPARSERVLRRVALEPSQEMTVSNPDGDAWIVQLYRLLEGRGEVLAQWTGDKGRNANKQRIRLREGAFLALHQLEPKPSVESLAQQVRSSDKGLARLAAALVSARAGEFELETLADLYTFALAAPDLAMRLPLLRAIAKQDQELAFGFVLEALTHGRLNSRLTLLEFAVTQGLLESEEHLRQVIGVSTPRLMRGFSDLIGDDARVSALMNGSPAIGFKVALLTGFAGRPDQRALEVLRAAVDDEAMEPEDRLRAMEALAATREPQATATLLEVLEDPARPVSYRRHALFLTWQMLQSRVPRFQTRLVRLLPRDALGTSILRVLRNLLEDPEPSFASLAVDMLRRFDHPYAVDGMRWLLEESDRERSLQAAVSYFTGAWFTLIERGYLAEEEWDSVLESLKAVLDRDIAVEIKEAVVELLVVVDKERAALDLMIEQLPLFADPSVELDTIRYFETVLGRPEVEEALLDLLLFPSSSLVALRARDLLERMGSSETVELYHEILAEGLDPDLLFGVAQTLLSRGETPAYDDVLRALLLEVRQAAGPFSSPDFRSSRDLFLEEAVGPVEVLQRMPAGFTEALVEWIVDMEFEAEELLEPLGVLILRAGHEGRHRDLLPNVLPRMGTTPDEVVQSFEESRDDATVRVSAGLVFDSFGPGEVWWGQTGRILQYLCEAFPRSFAVWRAHGRFALDQSGYGSLTYLDTIDGESSEAQLRLAQGCFEKAIALRDPERLDLQAELARIHGLLGHDDTANALYQEYLERRPADVDIRLALVDRLILAGDHRRAGEQLGQRPSGSGVQAGLEVEWWRRRIELALLPEDREERTQSLLNLLDDRGLPSDSGDRLRVLAPALRWFWEANREAPESIGGIQETLQALLLRNLKDFKPSVRSAAAFHLGWLGDERALRHLNEIARGDLSEFVRAECLHALYRMDTALAAATAKDSLADGSQVVRHMALWVLARLDRAIAADQVSRWLRAAPAQGDQRVEVETRRLQAIGAMVAFDLTQCMRAAAHLAENFDDPGVRSRASLALGWMGRRGHDLDFEVLRRVALYDEDPEVRLSAGRGLAISSDHDLFARARETIQQYIEGGLGALRSEEELLHSIYFVAFDPSAESSRCLEALAAHEGVPLEETESSLSSLDGGLIGRLATAAIELRRERPSFPERDQVQSPWLGPDAGAQLSAFELVRDLQEGVGPEATVPLEDWREAVDLMGNYPFFESHLMAFLRASPTTRLAQMAGLSVGTDDWIGGTQDIQELPEYFGGTLPTPMRNARALCEALAYASGYTGPQDGLGGSGSIGAFQGQPLRSIQISLSDWMDGL